MKYILIFEKNIKSSISYHFTLLYGNGINYYQNLNNYDYPKHIPVLQYLFKKMNEKLNGKHASPQIAHYIATYHDVPLWVLMTDLTLGETSTMYRYLKGRCKTNVCHDFRSFYHELKKAIVTYQVPQSTLNRMGFPPNWMSVLHIKVYETRSY